MIRSSERAALQMGQAALFGEARIHLYKHGQLQGNGARARNRAAGGQRLERCHTACEMARALGSLHAPVEVAALGYDWVAGSLQADVALEELYGLNLFLAGLARPRLERYHLFLKTQ